MLRANLAVNKQLEEGNGLLCAVLIHARHVEVIQKDHKALAHWGPICILSTLLCAVLQCHKARAELTKEMWADDQHAIQQLTQLLCTESRGYITSTALWTSDELVLLEKFMLRTMLLLAVQVAR